jgi:hypothetical protein
MTDQLDQEELLEVEEPESSPKESITDRLRKQHQEAGQRKTTDLDIPDFDGGLFCRYRLLSSDELDDIVRKTRRSTSNRSDRMLYMVCDNLILSCEEFFVRDAGEEIPLAQVIGRETPVRYDLDLATTLDFAKYLPDPPTARTILMGLFSNNSVAVQAHGARLSQWMMRSGRDLDELLGEV